MIREEFGKFLLNVISNDPESQRAILDYISMTAIEDKESSAHILFIIAAVSFVLSIILFILMTVFIHKEIDWEDFAAFFCVLTFILAISLFVGGILCNNAAANIKADPDLYAYKQITNILR